MAQFKLTDAKVRTLKGPAKLCDGGGLWLVAQASGAKQWVVRVTVRGKRKEMGLGGYPLITLEMARTAALDARRIAREGGNPITIRKQTEGVPTFQDAARKVHAERKPSWRNPKHADQFINTLTTYAFPVLGDMPVSEIESGHVLNALRPIWHEKAETARRLKQRINVVMKWSMAHGYRTNNPVEGASAGLSKQTKKVVPRKALPYVEAAQCIADVHASGAHPRIKLAVEFMVLCASRPIEIRMARWNQIDEDAMLWRIEGDDMKQGLTHEVPLSKQAYAVLIEAKKLSDKSDLIFAGIKHGNPISENTFVKLVRGLGYYVDAHGFRTTFRTWVPEQTSFDSDLAERALSHQIGNSARQAYDRSTLLEKRRPMMQAWADYLAGKPADVVSMDEARTKAAAS